jgi:pyridinium-3,5-biscarboxylic acid mononucleotide sulfurtransferase
VQTDPRTTAGAKYADLLTRLSAMRRVAVAFSGGVDSSLLLCAAREALGDDVLAVTALSPLYNSVERASALAIVAHLGVRHVFVDNPVLEHAVARHNPPDRCYHCKLWGFRAVQDAARSAGIEIVVEGSNVDDASDYRPGTRAIAELCIGSPLRDAGLTKAEIRSLAKAKGLANWDQPALACLGSRFPYGEEMTPQRLARIEAGEAAVRALGIRQVRVRDHGTIARIEVPPEAIATLAAAPVREQLAARLREIGYTYVALDLDGYRMGAMNAGVAPMRAAGDAPGADNA